MQNCGERRNRTFKTIENTRRHVVIISMALMKLRVIFEKNDYKIVNYLPGRKLKGEG